MSKELRPYQQAAVESLFDWYKTSREGNPLIVAPVGSGKTIIIAEIIKRIHADAPHTKIVVLTSTRELLTQNGDELKEHMPDVDLGYYCAALAKKKLHNDVTLASIQSIHNKAGYISRPPQIIIIDEAHGISHNGETQYRRFLDKCKEFNPKLSIIGLTGTPFRCDTGHLCEGDNAIFAGAAYEIDIAWLIAQGYLCKPITPSVRTGFDVSAVRIIKGDYAAGMLEKAVNVDEKTQSCVSEIIQQGLTRKKWLVFTAGVLHCEAVYEEFLARGVSCAMVTGKTPKEERKQIMDDYKSNKIKCLVNVAVLTTGFNAPEIDLIAFMRPTRSPVLYIQMLGRGLRLAPDKENLLLLDFGGVVRELGAIDEVGVFKKFKAKGVMDREKVEVLIKRCPACATECSPMQKWCYSCSYCFYQTALEDMSSAPLLSDEMEPEWQGVINIFYKEHIKRGAPNAPPTMRVCYSTMACAANEWVCFSHNAGSYAQKMAVDWHNKRLPKVPVPKSVNDALTINYPTPTRILVKKVKGFWVALDFEFAENDSYADAEFTVEPDLFLGIDFDELF